MNNDRAEMVAALIGAWPIALGFAIIVFAVVMLIGSFL
jgi:hypothetical protein